MSEKLRTKRRKVLHEKLTEGVCMVNSFRWLRVTLRTGVVVMEMSEKGHFPGDFFSVFVTNWRRRVETAWFRVERVKVCGRENARGCRRKRGRWRRQRWSRFCARSSRRRGRQWRREGRSASWENGDW